MDYSIRSCCSGTVLSSLLYEFSKCNYAQIQEGFLLGTVQSHISEHISDSQICNEKTETVINISSYLPCTAHGFFYNGIGKVDAKKLKTMLGENFENIIGWYKCRGGSFDCTYLIESLVHAQLAEIFSHTSGNFLMGLITGQPDGSSGTISMKYRFFLFKNNNFENISLEVVNMRETSAAEYILEILDPSPHQCKAVQTVMKKLNNLEPGVLELEVIHSGLISTITKLLPQFAKSQEKHQNLMLHVQRLRALCQATELKCDFVPQSRTNLNLMDIEEDSAEVSVIKERKGGGSNEENSLIIEDQISPNKKIITKPTQRNVSNTHSRTKTPSPSSKEMDREKQKKSRPKLTKIDADSPKLFRAKLDKIDSASDNLMESEETEVEEQHIISNKNSRGKSPFSKSKQQRAREVLSRKAKSNLQDL